MKCSRDHARPLTEEDVHGSEGFHEQKDLPYTAFSED